MRKLIILLLFSSLLLQSCSNKESVDSQHNSNSQTSAAALGKYEIGRGSFSIDFNGEKINIDSTEHTYRFARDFSYEYQNTGKSLNYKEVTVPNDCYNEIEINKRLLSSETDLAFIEKAHGDANFDKELEYVPIGVEGIALITSSENPVSKIDDDIFRSLLTGNEVYNWSQLGGKDGTVQFLGDNFKDIATNILKRTVKDQTIKDIAISDKQYKELFPNYDPNDGKDMPAFFNASNDYVLEPIDYFRLIFICSIEPQVGEMLKIVDIGNNELSQEFVLNDNYPYSLKTYAVFKNGSDKSENINKIIDLINKDENLGATKIANGIGISSKLPEEYFALIN